MQPATRPVIGPVQLVVIGFPGDAQFRGQILRELTELRGRGVIRLIDALFVRKDAQGSVTASMRDSDLTRADRQALGAVVGGLFGLAAGGDDESEALGATQAAHAIADGAFGFGIADLQKVQDQLPPSTSALLLLIEHQWALELKDAVRSAGGVPIVQGFLTPEALFMVGAELRAVTEAEDTIALAHAVEGAAVLAALATVEAAEMVIDAAVAETARVLLAAGLIEAAAVQEVIDTLVAADLIKQAALAEAKAAVERAHQEVAANTAAATNGNGPAARVPVGVAVNGEQHS